MHCGATSCCRAASAVPPDRPAPFRGESRVRGAAWSHRAKDCEGILRRCFPPSLSLYLLFFCLGLFVPVSVLGMNCLLCVCVLLASSLLRSRCITCHGLCMCRCCCECDLLRLLIVNIRPYHDSFLSNASDLHHIIGQCFILVKS